MNTTGFRPRVFRLLLIPALAVSLLSPGATGGGEHRPSYEPALGAIIASQGNEALLRIREQSAHDFRRSAFPRLPPIDAVSGAP